MSDEIPEEIRNMFPDQPFHKMDIGADGKLQILASTEPLEPDFENMPMEKVNEYLRLHGYDPDQVGLRGKVLTEALIENIDLRARAEAAEATLIELSSLVSFRHGDDENLIGPADEENDDPFEYTIKRIFEILDAHDGVKGGE